MLSRLPFQQQQHHHLSSLNHSLLHSEHRTTTWFPAPPHTSVCLHAASGVSCWRYTDRGLITWEHEVPYSLACSRNRGWCPFALLELFLPFFFLTLVSASGAAEGKKGREKLNEAYEKQGASFPHQPLHPPVRCALFRLHRARLPKNSTSLDAQQRFDFVWLAHSSLVRFAF